MILYDEDSDIVLPHEVSAIFDEKDSAVVQKRGSVSPDELDTIDIQAHVYRDSAKAEFGIFKSIFGAELKEANAGVVQESKRFTRIEENGKSVEFGVAVRLAVITSSLEMDVALSVANLAAAAQLGMIETRIKIKVSGFGGHVSDLPRVSGLDVENYQEYLDAFDKIQDQVFDIDQRENWIPTILSWEEKS